jgi:transcriptional regulator with XRE-family HTH domain
MEYHSMKIVEQIKRIRKLKKISQDEMSNLLNMSKSSYVRLENQKTELTIDCLNRIAVALETDFDTLIDSSRNVNNNNQNVILQQGNITILNINKEEFMDILNKIDMNKPR